MGVGFWRILPNFAILGVLVGLFLVESLGIFSFLGCLVVVGVFSLGCVIKLGWWVVGGICRL